jgi:nitrate reductase gamma subunit
MINYLLFIALPYAALAVFLIGSIYRYKSRGFQVSSLSTQFLEGKKLFWASLPFHWGLVFLFFGHLVAFMFPKAVLAWNGQSVRLIILEITAFTFGLSALIGLVLLIFRRMTEPRIKILTTRMDIVVYLVLLIQIASGLMVAYGHRWGSSWFASTLTPYLRSLFILDPSIDAVSAMPFWIQLHIVSAFSIVGLIPFTRFMHFLVPPFDYLFRSYQQVIWNWDKKEIRSVGGHTRVVKSKNN